MKKIFLATFVLIAFLTSCKNNSTEQTNSSMTDSSKFENSKLIVLYFHATNRCPTCNSVEQNVRLVIDSLYKSQLENKEIYFESLNFEQKQNQQLVEKYQIAMSTLLLITKDNQQENISDLTNIAFSFSRSQPETFKTIIADTIKKLLQ
mgnify:CR=1 FL=1